ncbi:MAG: AMP-binding protein [Eubacteriales bacterium]|nr:AMP-binding protein [Eubacteriales bacterium]
MQIMQGKRYFDAPPVYELRDIVARGKEIYPDRNAIVYRDHGRGDPVYVTYSELYDKVQAFKEALLHLGLRQEKISLVGANSFHWMLSYLTIVDQVGVVCPLDAMLTGPELLQLLLRSRSRALLADMKSLEALADQMVDADMVEHWILINYDPKREKENMEKFREHVSELGANFYLLEDLISMGQERLDRGERSEVWPITSDEMAVLLFTSGTTSESKAVMLSNANITADVRALLETVGFKDPLRTLSLLPLHHTFELTCGFLSVLSLGGQIHICDGLRYIGKNIEEYKVHMVIGVPKVFEAIYKRIQQNIDRSGQRKSFKRGLRLSKFLLFFGVDKRREIFSAILDGLGGNFYVAISGAAALDKEIIDFFYNIGIEILQGYGLTETAPVICGCNTQYNVRGSCGQPLSGVTLAIDADHPGVPGEILAQGDMVMLGYYQNEEATKDSFASDGWFKTGDIGYFDKKKKVLYLTGRAKSMIVLPSGKKVFPEELESLLNANEIVKDSLVFGQNSDKGDVVITAKIVLDQDKLAEENISDESLAETLDEYIREINRDLPSFKGIRSYAYSFQDMVKTTTLKVKRHVETERIKNLLQREKLGWRDLNGVNLDLLEAGLQQEKSAADAETASAEPELGKAQLRPTPVDKLAASRTTLNVAAGLDWDQLETQDIYLAKVESVAAYDRELRRLKRELDEELAIDILRQGQEEDLIYMKENEERKTLQSQYQDNIEHLHEEYRQKLLSFRSKNEDENLQKKNLYQQSNNALIKDFFRDLGEFNQHLPEHKSMTKEEKQQRKQAEKALKASLKANAAADKRQRKAFKKQLKDQHKLFESQIKQRKIERQGRYKAYQKELKQRRESDQNQYEELNRDINKALSANRQLNQELRKEQSDLLKHIKEKNRQY